MALNPTIDATHHHLDSTEWNGIYVIEDVHGCRETLSRLLDTLDLGECRRLSAADRDVETTVG